VKTSRWRPVLAAAAVPLVIIGALYVTNGLLSGWRLSATPISSMHCRALPA
jgi:hypothetical protein